MYMNTTYKAFVAKTAAGLMQTMVAEALHGERIDNKKSWNDNKDTYEHLAMQATFAAEALAQFLQDNWSANGDHETAFFDVQDSPTSNLESFIYDVAQKLDDLTEELKKQAKAIDL